MSENLPSGEKQYGAFNFVKQFGKWTSEKSLATGLPLIAFREMNAASNEGVI